MLGTFGDVSCMSIGAKKTMTSGEGGFLITSDPEIFIRATSLGHFEKRTKAAIKQIIENGHKDLAKKYQNSAIGYGENYRIHPYSAVMANALIESGDIYSIINNRKESLEYLSNKLNTLDRIYSPVTTDDFYTGAMYGFKAKIDVRNDIELDSIIKELKSRNIDIKRPDTGTLHQNSIFQYSYSDNDFSGAKEYLSGRVSLPTFSRGLAFDKDLIDQYTDVINYVLNGLFI